jgi:hypothetical protein
MRYVRKINLPADARDQLNHFVAERYPSLSVDWAGPSPSASGEGTVIGEIPAEEFATVDSFISDLSADGYGPRY